MSWLKPFLSYPNPNFHPEQFHAFTKELFNEKCNFRSTFSQNSTDHVGIKIAIKMDSKNDKKEGCSSHYINGFDRL